MYNTILYYYMSTGRKIVWNISFLKDKYRWYKCGWVYFKYNQKFNNTTRNWEMLHVATSYANWGGSWIALTCGYTVWCQLSIQWMNRIWI